jgi:PIN domain nuclease of toxin-antitoxin system
MKEGISGSNPEQSKIKQKTPEEIQAQIAAYATEKIDDNHNRGHVFNNIVSLAAGETEDVTRVTEDDEYNSRDEAGNLVTTLKGTERTIAAKDYSDFLRSVGGSKYEAIKGRAEILSAYKDFAPIVNELKESLGTTSSRREHASYLGSGSNASVFFIERNGKKYAVRVPDWAGVEVSPGAVDQHLAAAFLSKGVPHLEQIVAASYESGVTIAEVMPGKEMGKLTLEDIQAITDSQLAKFVDTLVIANEKDIQIDPKPSNFFYDREAGFGIVDLSSAKVIKNSKDQDVGTIVGWMVTPINGTGRYGRPYAEKVTVEEYAQELEFSKARLNVLRRYKDIVEQKLEGNDRETALKNVDKEIEGVEHSIANMNNPEWVSEQIAEAREREKEKEARGSTKATWLFSSGIDL